MRRSLATEALSIKHLVLGCLEGVFAFGQVYSKSIVNRNSKQKHSPWEPLGDPGEEALLITKLIKTTETPGSLRSPGVFLCQWTDCTFPLR